MNSLDWKNATPEQINLWKYARTLIAYTTVTPVYYMGPIAGSEFLTYNAGKLYVALEFGAIDNLGMTSMAYLTIYNHFNAISGYMADDRPAWDATAGVFLFCNNVSIVKNIYFGRITSSVYTMLKFNGYRLDV